MACQGKCDGNGGIVGERKATSGEEFGKQELSRKSKIHKDEEEIARSDGSIPARIRIKTSHSSADEKEDSDEMAQTNTQYGVIITRISWEGHVVSYCTGTLYIIVTDIRTKGHSHRLLLWPLCPLIIII